MSEAAQKVQAGRKPTIKLTAEAIGHCLTEDVIWMLVRNLRKFDVEDLVTASADYLGGRANAIKRRTVQEYVHRLTLGGYLEKTVVKIHGCQQECSWNLVRDIGTNAPRLTRDGSLSKTGAIRDQIWRTIKIIGEFNTIELAATASTESIQVTPNTVRPYIRKLYETGYLMLVREWQPRTPARYRKVPGRCQGKAPLVLKSREVFDRNLMKVMKPVR